MRDDVPTHVHKILRRVLFYKYGRHFVVTIVSNCYQGGSHGSVRQYKGQKCRSNIMSNRIWEQIRWMFHVHPGLNQY